MKTIKLIIATLVLAFVLASCGTDNNTNVQNTTQPTSTPKQTEGVVDEMGNAAKDVADGVGNGVKDMGDAAKNMTR